MSAGTGGWLVYLRLIRPPIVLGGLLGYCLGALLGIRAGGRPEPAVLVACYMVVVLGDVSTHFSNAYYDAEGDAGSLPKTFGGSNLLVGRPDLRGGALAASRLLSVASLGFVLVSVLAGAGTQIAVLAVAANLLGILYSAPPVRLVSRGLGEASIAVGTGFMIPAAGYIAAAGGVSERFLVLSAPLVILGFCLSLSLEAPDMEADRIAGKLNLVARWGREASTKLVAAASAAAALALPYFWGDVSGLSGATLTVLGAFPLAAAAFAVLSRAEDHKPADRLSSAYIVSLLVVLAGLVGLLAVSG